MKLIYVENQQKHPYIEYEKNPRKNSKYSCCSYEMFRHFRVDFENVISRNSSKELKSINSYFEANSSFKKIIQDEEFLKTISECFKKIEDHYKIQLRKAKNYFDRGSNDVFTYSATLNVETLAALACRQMCLINFSLEALYLNNAFDEDGVLKDGEPFTSDSPYEELFNPNRFFWRSLHTYGGMTKAHSFADKYKRRGFTYSIKAFTFFKILERYLVIKNNLSLLNFSCPGELSWKAKALYSKEAEGFLYDRNIKPRELTEDEKQGSMYLYSLHNDRCMRSPSESEWVKNSIIFNWGESKQFGKVPFPEYIGVKPDFDNWDSGSGGLPVLGTDEASAYWSNLH